MQHRIRVLGSAGMFTVSTLLAASLAHAGGGKGGGGGPFVDDDGCETVSGFALVNHCNPPSQPSGRNLDIANGALYADYNFRGTGNSSAYATLYCSDDLNTAVFRGVFAYGATAACASMPKVSYCGANPLCAQK